MTRKKLTPIPPREGVFQIWMWSLKMTFTNLKYPDSLINSSISHFVTSVRSAGKSQSASFITALTKMLFTKWFCILKIKTQLTQLKGNNQIKPTKIDHRLQPVFLPGSSRLWGCYRGFPAFLGRSTCLKTAKLRRLDPIRRACSPLCRPVWILQGLSWLGLCYEKIVAWLAWLRRFANVLISCRIF